MASPQPRSVLRSSSPKAMNRQTSRVSFAAGRERRTSAWQAAGGHAKRGVANLGNAVGRWLGVTASEDQVHERMEAYRRRKSGWETEQNRRGALKEGGMEV